jgi:hypothetical protein
MQNKDSKPPKDFSSFLALAGDFLLMSTLQLFWIPSISFARCTISNAEYERR